MEEVEQDLSRRTAVQTTNRTDDRSKCNLVWPTSTDVNSGGEDTQSPNPATPITKGGSGWLPTRTCSVMGIRSEQLCTQPLPKNPRVVSGADGDLI